MTEYRTIKIMDEQGILTVQLNREDTLNSFDGQMMRELTDLACALRHDAGLKAVILKGADGFFSAGADLSLVQDLFDLDQSALGHDLVARRELVMAGPDLCKAWEDIRAVTIVAIEGYCIGAGAALALSCDFRIMGQSANMRLPEVPLGMNMSWQTLPRLAGLVGPSRAKRMAMFGHAISASDLHAWGGVDDCVGDGQAYDTAKSWAEELAGLPQLPVRMTKEAVNASANFQNHATSFMDCDQYLLTSMSDEFRANIAAFLKSGDDG